MTKYLISFDDGAMTFPEEELPDDAEAALAVRRVVDVASREEALAWAAKIAAACRCGQEGFELVPDPSD